MPSKVAVSPLAATSSGDSLGVEQDSGRVGVVAVVDDEIGGTLQDPRFVFVDHDAGVVGIFLPDELDAVMAQAELEAAQEAINAQVKAQMEAAEA